MSGADDFIIEQCSGSVAAGTSAINGEVQSTDGAAAITVIASLGDVTTGSVLTLQLQHGTSSSTASMSDIAGASCTFTAGASDADDKILAVTIHRPKNAYYRGVLTRTTANAVLNNMTALKFNVPKTPTGLTPGDVIAKTVIAVP